MTAPLAYLDNNASTRVDPAVIDVMLPLMAERYGNPSSLHHFGASVAADIEHARARIAGTIGARDSEIVFTSGGTESNNAVLRGVLAARPGKRRLVLSQVEHHAVLEPAQALEADGMQVVRIGVDSAGRLKLDQLREALTDDTALVSIMLANNETGVIMPVRQVCEMARQRRIPVHTDAVQALGRIDLDVETLGVSFLSLSAHKAHGPKGVGALYARRGAPWRPFHLGGPQEHGRRGGTLNAPGILGFAKACELISGPAAAADRLRVRALRDRFEGALLERFGDRVRVIGGEADRTPNTCCVCFAGLSAEPILMMMSEAGICASSGAACSSGSLEPSHVLEAMGVDPVVAQGQVRFSLSRFTTSDEIDRTLDRLPAIVDKVAAVGV